jgi:hypothetical protein
VPHFETWFKSHRWFWNYLSLLCFIAIGECAGTAVYAQSCPVNIDFETGTFANWTCYVGRTSVVGDKNVISLSNSFGPVSGHHTMYGGNTSQLDPFGGFPVLCPNGSGHSIRLGSTEAGARQKGYRMI